MGAVNEPVPGWIDNTLGSTGLIYGAWIGVIRIMCGRECNHACLVPIDYTVNGLIASAWDAYVNKERRNEDPLVYNYVTPMEQTDITWSKLRNWSMLYMAKYPSRNSIWYVYASAQPSHTIYLIQRFFYHQLPAAVVDFALICIGKKPRLVKLYAMIHKFLVALQYFTEYPKDFKDENVVSMWRRLDPRDRKIFPFDMRSLNWYTYYHDYLKAMRLYLLKEDFDDLEYCRARQRVFYWVDWIVKILFVLFVSWIMWKLYSIVLGISGPW